MMNMGMVIDLDQMTIKVKDSKEPEHIQMTESGHVVVPIGRCEDRTEHRKEKNRSGTVFQINNQDPKKIADHLHRVMAHASTEKIGQWLKTAKFENKDNIIDELKKVCEKCDFCLKHKSRATPVRKVSMPQGTTFNEVVAMDLKMLSLGQIILHMVDTVTRYSVAARVNNKGAPEIMEKVFKSWVAVFGRPHTFVSDNGGEFVNETFNQACSLLNIRIKTSPAESPWCNGVVERHNGILGRMIESVTEEVGCSVDIAIAWSVHAKNSLNNTYGFSPHQLVFGRNPRVPGILNETVSLPTLNDEDVEKVVCDHLNALTLARQKFVELEASDMLKRTLKQRVYPNANRKYYSGDIVYFKREKKKFWYGPAVVVGHSANQVLIKHGGLIVRVHPCKVVLKSSADDQVNGNPISTEDDQGTQPTVETSERAPPTVNEYEEDEREENQQVTVQAGPVNLSV